MKSSVEEISMKGVVAFVTGGGSGIGRAICLNLIKEGASVAVVDISEKQGKETLALIGKLGEEKNCLFIPCDVTDFASLYGATKTCIAKFGRLDIFCNNAGIGDGEAEFYQCTGKKIEESYRIWKKVVDINLNAVMLGTQIAIQEMRKLKRGGLIVNTASMAGLIPMSTTPIYSATKAGVVHFSRALASLSDEGIYVNAICPSFTDTPLLQNLENSIVESMKKMIGGKLVDPNTVAQGVIQLWKHKKGGQIMRITIEKGIDIWRDRSKL